MYEPRQEEATNNMITATKINLLTCPKIQP